MNKGKVKDRVKDKAKARVRIKRLLAELASVLESGTVEPADRAAIVTVLQRADKAVAWEIRLHSRTLPQGLEILRRGSEIHRQVLGPQRTVPSK